MPRQILDFELQDIGHYRPFDPYRVVLFRLRAVIRHMFGGVVNAADKGNTIINHHNFAVHSAEDIGSQPQ
ncbi:Uncharacterised protein [Salmonella enterica subsp. enterica serovar Bovismorbificans]|uniref:Uncharacterized protein n=1 Tax=Salmonella enterica subsp. enterica serovar Bovismorbificans TaxID=58097 RepID=A0A655BP85_SALET|nr:Uncharacterised protein [Salmonella enterica subsp. enterica serovar Bovismorbificans]CNT65946.1 Uncharacterised protein [Salmonella enterica subsp. enterica serovar Bovismorbificans]